MFIETTAAAVAEKVCNIVDLIADDDSTADLVAMALALATCLDSLCESLGADLNAVFAAAEGLLLQADARKEVH